MGAAATVSLAGATLGSGEGLIKSISLVCFFQSCKAALRVFDDMYTYNIYIYIYLHSKGQCQKGCKVQQWRNVQVELTTWQPFL